MEVSGRHARTRAITRDAVLPANQPDPATNYASRDVARVVSDVSVWVRGLVSNSTTRVLIDRKRRDRDETAEARSLSIFGRQVGRAATEFDMIKQRALA
jgi:hypothetical protein